MTLAGYKVRKAAQIVAFFAKKEGGQISTLKLVKLIYLSDRASLRKYDYPILFDQLVSMDHGPVNSRTLNYINGLLESSEWDEFVSDKNNHEVGLTNKKIDIDDLDELSDAEIAIVEEVWEKFGKMGKWEIRDYTHEACLEWEDPKGSSVPIPYERIFKFLGKKDAASLDQSIIDERYIYSF